MPYTEQDLILSTIEVAGESYDIGLHAAVGWDNLTLMDLLTQSAPADTEVLTKTETGIHIQAPSLDLAGLSLQGPALDLSLILPNPELPFYQYEQSLGSLEIDSQAVEWGVIASVGWENTKLLDLISDHSLPTADLSVYINVPEGAGRCLPSHFQISQPQLKMSLLGKTLLFDFGQSISVQTPECYAEFIDDSLAPIEASMPPLDLDAMVDGEFTGYTIDGTETVLNLQDSDALTQSLWQLLQVIPNQYHLNDPQLIGQLFGFDFGSEPNSRFDPINIPLADIAPQLADFSLSDLLPSSLFDLIEPLIDSSSEPVELTIPTIDFGTIGSSVPVVDQFLELMQVMPSTIRLFNPQFTANVFGQTLNHSVPLDAVVKATGIDFLTSGSVAADDPALQEADSKIAEGDHFISFNLLDALPEQLKQILAYFVDTESSKTIDLQIPTIDFGKLDASTLASGSQQSLEAKGAAAATTTATSSNTGSTASDGTAVEETPSEWIDLAESGAATDGVSEIQALAISVDKNQLPSGPDAPTPTFVLSLGTIVTDPIEVLVLGEPVNEVQQLVISKVGDLQTPPAPVVATSYQLTIDVPKTGKVSNVEKFTLSLQQADGSTSKISTASFNNNASTQVGALYDAVASLLGLKKHTAAMVKNYAVSGLNTITVVGSPDLLVRSEVSSSKHQVFTIELSANMQKKLANQHLVVNRSSQSAANTNYAALTYSLQAKTPAPEALPPLALGYTVSLAGKEASIEFIAPTANTKAAIASAMQANSQSLQTALDQLLGIGNVLVSNHVNTQSVWQFQLEFKGALAGKNIGDLIFTPNQMTDGRLSLSQSTVVDGSAGATTGQQLELIQAALDQALGADAVTVSVDTQNHYRLALGGDNYSNQDIAQIHAIKPTTGVTVATHTITNGVAAQGPGYLLDTASLTGYGSFSIELTVDGTTYLANDVSTTIDAVTTLQAIAVAKCEAVDAVDEHQQITIIHTTNAVGQPYWLSSDGGQKVSLEFQGDAEADAASIEAVLETWYGVGSVSVSYDETNSTSTEWVLDIQFQADMVGVDVLQISAESADSTSKALSFQSVTISDAVASVDAGDLAQLGISLTLRAATATEGNGWIIGFDGALDAHTIDGVRIQLIPDAVDAPVETPAATRPMAVGGVVVRNDVRGSAHASIIQALVEASAVTVAATDNAIIKAKVDSTAEASGGEGSGLAVGGVIATNLVLSNAQAWIAESTVETTDGDVVVEGLNSAHIVASNKSAMSSDGTSIGATLAFNTVGWEAQNVLFSTIDALVGSNIGKEQPAQMRAFIENSDIKAAGSVSVNAKSEAYINAFLSNETSSEVAAAEGNPDATDTAAQSAAKPKGLALGFVLT
ncbi:MAG: hypothetical protein ACKN9F_11515, partial [Methylomonas sp.]